MLEHLLIFTCGACIEAGCVLWTHFSERGRALPTALCSLSIGLFNVFGISGALDDWTKKIFFALGYGAGTYMMVRGKEYFKARLTGSKVHV